MSKRGENITKRKDGRWEARYIKGYENGKAVYGYLYGKSYAEAKNKKMTALSTMNNIKRNDSTEIFGTLLDSFLLQKKYCVKESTYAHYCNLVENHIRPSLGYIKLCDLSTYVIEKFADEKLKKGKVGSQGGLSTKTVKDLLTLVKSILKYGISKEIVPQNIVSFSSPKVTKKEIEILSGNDRENLEQFTMNADNIHFGIYLCLYTGMRIGEVCALKWNDIDLCNSTISVNKTIQRISLNYVDGVKKTKIIIDSPKTEASKRVIPLPFGLCQLLIKRKHNESLGSNYFLTNSEKYIESRNYYAKYREILKECGVSQYTFHALRHTFATRCIEIGFDPKVLSEILGHTDVKITLDRYVHPSIDRKRACMELLYAH